MHQLRGFAVVVALLLLAPVAESYEATKVSNGGAIAGKVGVTVKGLQDESLTIGKGREFCGGSVPAQKYLVAPDGGLKNVVVMIEEMAAGKPFDPGTEFVMTNKDCRFDPHVMIAPKGAMMKVRNDDPLLHNSHFYLVQANSKKNVINLALPKQGIEISKKKILRKSGLLSVECDAHDFMQAWLWVVANPYAVLTDASGDFTLEDIPAGSYKLRIWHEALGEKTVDVTVEAGKTAAVNASF